MPSAFNAENVLMAAGNGNRDAKDVGFVKNDNLFIAVKNTDLEQQRLTSSQSTSNNENL